MDKKILEIYPFKKYLGTSRNVYLTTDNKVIKLLQDETEKNFYLNFGSKINFYIDIIQKNSESYLIMDYIGPNITEIKPKFSNALAYKLIENLHDFHQVFNSSINNLYPESIIYNEKEDKYYFVDYKYIRNLSKRKRSKNTKILNDYASITDKDDNSSDLESLGYIFIYIFNNYNKIAWNRNKKKNLNTNICNNKDILLYINTILTQPYNITDLLKIFLTNKSYEYSNYNEQFFENIKKKYNNLSKDKLWLEILKQKAILDNDTFIKYIINIDILELKQLLKLLLGIDNNDYINKNKNIYDIFLLYLFDIQYNNPTISENKLKMTLDFIKKEYNNN